MDAFLATVAAQGDRLCRAAQAIGGSINFGPRSALMRDAALGLQAPGRWSPNRHCQLIEARDGWIAVNLAREDDRASVAAWIGGAPDASPWDAIVAAARMRFADDLLAAAIALHLPVARVGETAAAPPAVMLGSVPFVGQLRRAVPIAIDLSALWAGPYCGGLLAEAGVDVTRIDSPSRPDPTAITAPALDARLNGAKRRACLALGDPKLRDRIAAADILITSGRPHALARAGLTEATLFAANPALIWVAITAHGWRGDAAMRVGFGDDTAAAGGLVDWHGDEPHFIGDALADPLTGIAAATAALETLAYGGAGLIDVALAPTAASTAQMIAAA